MSRESEQIAKEEMMQVNSKLQYLIPTIHYEFTFECQSEDISWSFRYINKQINVIKNG